MRTNHRYKTIKDLMKGITDSIRDVKGSSGDIQHQDIPTEISLITKNPGSNITLTNIRRTLGKVTYVEPFNMKANVPCFGAVNMYSAGTYALYKNEIYAVGGNDSNTIFYKYVGTNEINANKYDTTKNALTKIDRPDGLVDYWISLGKMGYNGRYIGAAEMANGLHVFGGAVGNSNGLGNKHYVVDVAEQVDATTGLKFITPVWTALNPLPVTDQMQAFWTGDIENYSYNKIIIKGAKTGSTCKIYSCADDSYEEIPAAPTRRSYIHPYKIGNYLWLIGGHINNPGTSNTSSAKTALRYNFTTSAWEVLPDLPFAGVYDLVKIDGKTIYFRVQSNYIYEESDRIIKWNETAHSWDVVGFSNKRSAKTHPAVTKTRSVQTTAGDILVTPIERGSDAHIRAMAWYNTKNIFTTYNDYTLSWNENHASSPMLYYSKDKCIHVFSETQSTYTPVYCTHIVYDFNNKMQIRKENLPFKDARYANYVELNQKIHMLGGNGDPNAHYIWDEINDTWTQLNDLPYASFLRGVTYVYNNQIHIIGGSASASQKLHYVYDDSTDSWSQLANMPLASYNGEVCVTEDNKVYYYAPYGNTDAIFVSTDGENFTLLKDSIGMAGTGKACICCVEGDIYLYAASLIKCLPKEYLDDTTKENLITDYVPVIATADKNNRLATLTVPDHTQFISAKENQVGQLKYDEKGECTVYWYPNGAKTLYSITFMRKLDVATTRPFYLKDANGTTKKTISANGKLKDAGY